jgi:hypothetical protein
LTTGGAAQAFGDIEPESFDDLLAFDESPCLVRGFGERRPRGHVDYLLMESTEV